MGTTTPRRHTEGAAVTHAEQIRRLKAVMADRSLSAAALAKQANVDQSNISSLLAGKRRLSGRDPRTVRLFRTLARTLGLKPTFFDLHPQLRRKGISEFGKHVYKERMRRGWSQPELARRSGVGRSLLASLEALPDYLPGETARDQIDATFDRYPVDAEWDLAPSPRSTTRLPSRPLESFGEQVAPRGPAHVYDTSDLILPPYTRNGSDDGADGAGPIIEPLDTSSELYRRLAAGPGLPIPEAEKIIP